MGAKWVYKKIWLFLSNSRKKKDDNNPAAPRPSQMQLQSMLQRHPADKRATRYSRVNNTFLWCLEPIQILEKIQVFILVLFLFDYYTDNFWLAEVCDTAVKMTWYGAKILLRFGLIENLILNTCSGYRIKLNKRTNEYNVFGKKLIEY